MKVKFCQFELWMLYCTSVVLSGKLFRTKPYYGWILSPSICCTSPSPVNWFTLFAVEGFTFFRSTPGCRMKGEQWTLLYRCGWTTLECGHFIVASRTNTLVFVCILLGMSIASLCNQLGLNPARQRSLNLLWFFFESAPIYCTYFRLITATFEILINDKFPPELSLLAAQNETQQASSETWAWRYQFSISRLNAYLLTEYIYKLKCIET